MKKIASVLVLIVIIASCKKKQNPETLTISDTTIVKSGGLTTEQKEYFLVKLIEKKDFPVGKTFKIDGLLKDKNGKSDFKNLELVLQDSLNKVIRRATVKPDGKFTFYKVESGDYKIALDSVTMMATADKIRITKTEDYIKDDINDKFDIGKTLTKSEVNDRFLADIFKDSLLKAGSNKISGKIFHTAKKKLPKLVTYLLIDSKNTILRKVEWNTNDDLNFSKLSAADYKVLTTDPIPGAKMKVAYLKNIQHEIAKIDNFKLGDIMKASDLAAFTSHRFKADTLDERKFEGLLIHNGEVADEEKIILLNNENKIEHELTTSQLGGFHFDKLNSEGIYTIVVPSKEKGYRIKHTNPKEKFDELDSLEMQLLKQRTMQEILSQGMKPEKFDKAKVQKCLDRIEKRLAKNPNDADLLFKKGVMLFELEDYNSSIEAFDKTTHLKPDYAQAYIYRGDAKDYMGDFEGAVNDYSRNLEYMPTNIVANYKRGIVRKDIGQAKGAVEDLTKVINAHPEYHYPYFYRGLARYQIAKYNDAVFDYNKALAIQPNLQEAHFNKGLAYMQLRKYPDAHANFSKTIEMNPSDADAHLLRGQTRTIMGRQVEANQDFDEAIKLDPNLEVAYYEKANMRFTLGDEEGARKMYDEAVEKFHSDYEPYYQRGVFYFNIKDYKNSIEDLNKAASIYDRDPFIYYYRALTNQKLKNKLSVCEDARKSLNLGYVDTKKELEGLVNKYCK